MGYTNGAMLIKREITNRFTKLYYEGKLETEIDKIPLIISPKMAKKPVRCCIYKEREVVNNRLISLLGIPITPTMDELMRPSDYIEIAKQREDTPTCRLNIIDAACSSCSKEQHVVTNHCRGCVAQPCMLNCPKNAISFIDGKAEINADTCVNCGICRNVCPFHAIINTPVPCEQACPVDAISKDKYGIARLDEDKCIHCGKCITACPYGAVTQKSHLYDVMKSIDNGKKVIAMLAPAVIGQYNVDLEKIISGVKELGFFDVVEVAVGAEMTAAEEAHEWKERMEEGAKFMTTSCCPAYVELAEKHITDLKPFVSTTPSPMVLTDRWVKTTHPDAITVFVGPCVAKRSEAINKSDVKYVLNFEELGAMLISKGIELSEQSTDVDIAGAGPVGRGFAQSGGVAAAIKTAIPEGVNEIIINGLDKPNMRALKSMGKGKCDGNFVEVMVCTDGCVAGPSCIADIRVAKRQLAKYLNRN